MDRQTREQFEDLVGAPDQAREIARLAHDVKAGGSASALPLAAAFAHVAFVAPELARSAYDIFTQTWLDAAEPAALAPAPAGEPLTEEFWSAFWSIVDDAQRGLLDPTTITARVAGLGASLPADRKPRSEAIARAHPKLSAPHHQTPPARLTLEALSNLPPHSLGRDILELVQANKFDLEVLDRETIGLGELPPALRFLNTRILQMHDVWHMIGGYRTTGLHEIGISAFQLAQFGHGYSAMLLATVITITSLRAPDGLMPLLQTMAEAWRHGSATPSLMAIDWENELKASIADIRSRYRITPFAGSLPSDLLEQAFAAA